MKKVFYLGPEDSYSHAIATHVITDKRVSLLPAKSFAEIVEHVMQDREAVGILPIENSITSDIHENIDSLFKNNLHIFYEVFLRIQLHLIGLPGSEKEQITTVYSHERALAQCSNFIKTNHLQAISSTSTAEGRNIVLERQDKTIGVIGSKELANNPQFKILQKNIGNDAYNITRFVFITKDSKQYEPNTNKTSLTFTVPHIPGALAILLTQIANKHLNVTKIESRPIPGTNWEYQFWIDIENTNGILEMSHVEEIFKKNTQSYRIVGMYKSGGMYE